MTRRPIVLTVAFERPFSVFTPRGMHLDPDRKCVGTIADPVRIIAEELDASPLLVPTYCRVEDVPDLIARAEGILLPGGNSNIQPQLYKHANCPNTEQVFDPARDRLEFALLDEAYRQKKPVLGICRGMQMINVWRGGTLNQSFPQGHYVNHMVSVATLGKDDAPAHNHGLKIASGSHLSRWMMHTGETQVNSWHEQSVNVLGNDLIAEAYADDGIVEAFRLNDPSTFMYGVQWHPDFNPNQPASRAILKAFREKLHVQTQDGGWMNKVIAAGRKLGQSLAQ